MRPAIDVSRLHEMLAACIKTPSPQTDMGAVRVFIADVIRPYLEDLPFDSLTLDDMGNLVGRLGGGDAEPPFMLCTYAGTVPAGNMPDPFVPRVVDGAEYGQAAGPHMWGRGTSEQMAALAAALEAVRVFCDQAQRLRREVLFATTVAGEMGCHDAVEHMMRAGQLGFGPTLLAVGTNNAVYAGNMGRIDIHVEVFGQACHSSNPAHGRNAIEGARQFLTELKSVPLPPPDPDLGQPSLTPTLIASSPTISHTVPDHCRLVLDRRLIPGEEMEQALADISKCADGVTELDVRVEGGRFNYPSKTSLDSPLVQAALAALRSEGLGPACRYARWTLDAGFFTREGVDAILLGPGDERMAHTDAEMVALKDVELAASAYVRVLKAMALEE